MARSQEVAGGKAVVGTVILIAMVGSGVSLSNGTVRGVLRPDPKGPLVAIADVPDRAVADRYCPLGLPQKFKALEEFMGDTKLIVRNAYILEHSAQTRGPYWVCEALNQSHLAGDNPKRENKFQADKENLDEGERSELSDYEGLKGIFDRGHMMPDADRHDSDLKLETFYLSNIVPQDSVLNQKQWRFLEARARQWVCSGRKLWIMTGPLWYDPQEDDPALADGRITIRTIGKNQVSVPTHIFKIVLSDSTTNPQGWELLAFVMPNRPEYPKEKFFAEYLRSVDWIEARSGFDFFPDKRGDVDFEAMEAVTPWALWPVERSCKSMN